MTATASDGLHILLVGDSAIDRELVKRRLGDPAPLPAPVKLTTVSDAESALAAVRAQTFSVVVVDYSLPGRNGLELLRDLRAVRDDLPVVMITGAGDEGVPVAALQRGASDYVTKQLGFERALLVIIERVLQKHALARQAETARHEGLEHERDLERRLKTQTAALERARRECQALRVLAFELATAREVQAPLPTVARAATAMLAADASAVVVRLPSRPPVAAFAGALASPERLGPDDVPDRLAPGFHETTSAALLEHGEDVGIVWVGRCRDERFDDLDRELLETLAGLTIVSLQNVVAHERLRALETDAGPPDIGPSVPSGRGRSRVRPG